MFLFLYVYVLKCWLLLHSEYTCTLQYAPRFLFSVPLACHLTVRIVYFRLLPYSGSHIIKTDCLAEFDDFGLNRDYLVPSAITREGELTLDVYSKPAARVW